LITRKKKKKKWRMKEAVYLRNIESKDLGNKEERKKGNDKF
jgi:hypothetical protein